jgi:hypothetical protein
MLPLLPETRFLSKNDQGTFVLTNIQDDYMFRDQTTLGHVSLYNFIRRFHRVKKGKTWPKTCHRFTKAHPMHESHYLMEYQVKNYRVPWIVGPSIPRASKHPEKHAKLASLLFRPFKDFSDLRLHNTTWEDSWAAYLPTLQHLANDGDIADPKVHDATVSLSVLLHAETINRGLEVMSEERRVRAEMNVFIKAAPINGQSPNIFWTHLMLPLA